MSITGKITGMCAGPVVGTPLVPTSASMSTPVTAAIGLYFSTRYNTYNHRLAALGVLHPPRFQPRSHPEYLDPRRRQNRHRRQAIAHPGVDAAVLLPSFVLTHNSESPRRTVGENGSVPEPPARKIYSRKRSAGPK